MLFGVVYKILMSYKVAYDILLLSIKKTLGWTVFLQDRRLGTVQVGMEGGLLFIH